MSSRLIVKNLPKNITEAKLRQLFEEKGTLTDIQLKYTKEGVFRQFAFVGYENESDANAALKHFNNAFIQTTKIKVEHCAELGSKEKPKSRSKHPIDSNSNENGVAETDRLSEEKLNKSEKTKTKKPSKIDEIVGEYKNDEDFQEFMKLHDKNRTLWANDEFSEEISRAKKVSKSDTENHQEESAEIEQTESSKLKPNAEEQSDDEGSDSEKENEDNDLEHRTLALKNEVSDLDYMKALIKDPKSENKKVDKQKSKEKKKKVEKKSEDFLTIKIHNIPFKTKKQDILKFFKPLKPNSVRIPIGSKGFCYVGFKLEKDFNKAMLKDKSFIKGKQVYFSNFTEKNKITKSKKENEKTEGLDKSGKWSKQHEGVANEEDISESGKIFFRNLAYTIGEDDLQNLFEQFGPIAEISLPIDPITRKIKGFGTVTFVMPEHAVLAFNKLDGTSFHGRLLHLIPGKAKDNEEQDENAEGLSFKAKKALKLKKSASQTHNWNTLFLGANAVADILAKKFETSKEIILDANTGGSSAAVRLALGESQVVMEMKQFLEENDVQLDVFETVPKKRSKTIILAKNLPAETTVEELTDIFSKFGLLGRLVLPPSGVTAIIEFLDPFEAKKAFYKLAYSKFKHLPLYLEWAHENTFKVPLNNNKNIEEQESGTEKSKSKNSQHKYKDDDDEQIAENEKNTTSGQSKQEIVEEDDDDEPPETGTTLFLRNLNFNTREEAVKKHFIHLGPVHLAQVAMRKDAKNPQLVTSLGYGFIQFKKRATAERALKEMQFTTIDGNAVELKRSDRTLVMDEKSLKKKAQHGVQTGTKIMVRNLPFQAKTKEVFELFKAFGELRSVRLPKKLTPGEQSIRGFGFVDYLSKSDAKRAFEALSSSTHLYGRRLVLEWAKEDTDDVTELRKRTAETFKDVGGKKSKSSRKAIFDASEITENEGKSDDDA